MRFTLKMCVVAAEFLTIIILCFCAVMHPILQISFDPTREINGSASEEKSFFHVLFSDPLAFFTMLLAFFTIVLAITTVRIWLDTRSMILDQGRATEKALSIAASQAESLRASIFEAQRSASAMEEVANQLEVNSLLTKDLSERQKLFTQAQMRAYIGVNSGTACYQDESHIFEGMPVMLNSGQTPAHNVSYWARAEIRSVPLEDDFEFRPIDKQVGHRSILVAHQTFGMNAAVDGKVELSILNEVKAANGKALYIWGMIDYEDEFHEPHFTKTLYNVCF